MAKAGRKTESSDYRSSALFFIIAGLIVVLTLAVYWQVHNFEFLSFDDDKYITENPNIRLGFTLEGIKWAFSSMYYIANWHPLTWLSLMLDYKLYGMNGGGFHVTNLIFHLASTVLLFWVFVRMTKALWPSAFVAAMFALHPLHVESVAWVSERKDVLSTFFWFLTMLAYLRYTERKTKSRYAAVIILFALGLMAKPMLVTLPFVLLLTDYWPLGLFSKNSILEKLPLFAISVVSSVITFFAQKGSGVVAAVDILPVWVRISNAIVSYMRYIDKTIRPVGLSILYPHPRENIKISYVVIAVVLLIVITAIAVLFRNRRWLMTGWLWYLGTLVPVIGIVQVGAQSMADRYTYIPLVGIFVIVGWGGYEIFPRIRYRNLILASSGMVIIFALAVRSFGQAGYWRNDVAIYEHSLSVTEDNFMLRYNLASYLGEKGDTKKAIEQYLECLRMEPSRADIYYSLGCLYGKKGDIENTLKCYLEAVRIEPCYADAYNNLGAVYGGLGRYDEAIEAHKQVIRIRPDDAGVYYNLGISYSKVGRRQEAIDSYKQAVRIKPDYWGAYYNLGAVYGEVGRYEDAIEAFRQAVGIKRDYAEAHFNLGLAYLLTGDRAAAVEEYEILKTINAEWAGRLFGLINR